MTTTTSTSAYVPGVCNINPTETAYRRKAGWAGVAISLIVLIPLLLTHLARGWRLIVILPVFLGALGFLQARHRFCVSYAGRRQQNAAGTSMAGAKDVSPADHVKDMLLANKLYLQAAVIAAAVAVGSCFIPTLR